MTSGETLIVMFADNEEGCSKEFSMFGSRFVSRVVVLLICFAGVARAEDRELARHAYRSGTRHYNLGEYEQALSDFQMAYRQYDDPSFLFNIGQCERQLGRRKDAIGSYRAYLREAKTPPNRPEIERLIAELRVEQERGVPPTTAPAKPPSTEQAPALVTTPSNSATYLPTSTKLAEKDSPSRHWYRSPVGWGLVGLGAAAGATGIGLILHGRSLDDQARSAQNLGAQRSLHSSSENYSTAGWIVAGGGVASLLASVAVFTISSSRRKSPARISVRVSAPGFVSFGGAW